MKKIFDFDFTLGHLMDLSLSPFKKIDTLFKYLTNYWYVMKNGEIDKERWERIRIGTCNVYLDDEDVLHMDFATRFSLKNATPPLPQELFEDEGLDEFLAEISKL